MSFGIGAGDIILLTSLAWKLYKACKDAPADFARLSSEILSLHAVLSETHDFLSENPALDTSRRNRLSILCEGCEGVLADLDALYNRYDSLPTQSQRAWDRIKFGLQDVSQIRERLVSSATLLTAWNSAMVNSSTARIDKLLTKLVAEVQAGLREGSVVTQPDVAETIDSPDVWKELRRDLEDVGISAVIVEENKNYILTWMKQAFQDGSLDERCDPTSLPSPSRSLEVGHLPSDSGYGGSETHSEQGRKGSGISLCLANNVFEEELRQQRVEWRPGEDGRQETGEWVRARSDTDMTVPAVKVRRRTDPVGLIRKLFKNETDVIEAASDGDIDKVAKLISLGMDVNARDRWGWSALSMCGYGGFKNIARLLLDHGADLDNVDVDGDTPSSLAVQRGHAELVIMFDEERAARDLRVREEDMERPRR
ncbi:potassium channel AKT1 [Staphylotrichum tortipilum]|uniref:Potassium channel AKT1 n=1 Tax=Staphylotrichum tortipilum TaxID=2831512 RepID=A0AAN6MAJ3_9PEZI|nr:potassium channel AKT1 [Staphylotrichum longicolle]